MKKYALHCIECALVTVLILTSVPQLVQAQEPTPTNWDSFINSADNPIVSDTFRMQTFAGKETDNWRYTLSGGAENKLSNDRHVIKLPPASSISFETYTLNKYSEVVIYMRLAGRDLMPKENLSSGFLKNGSIQENTIFSPNTEKQLFNFQRYHLSGNPSSLEIWVSKPAVNTANGYYMTDTIYAFGNIHQYSLFTNTGNWDDTTHWSHLPPLRHRKALISGKITTLTNIRCENTAVNNGNLHISPGTTFSTNALILYTENSTLSSEGELLINGPLTIQKTFAEKGKWYFISFPFDVYASNIASPFVQKDDRLNSGGDFYYIQTYNSEKRAANNKASGNWEVLPICSGNTPVFEKNKGYLIALDEKATTQTLTFSSKPGDIPSDFARNGSIPVSSSNVGTDKDNQGWYLCGNPFPSPLKLSELENTSTLDGYIYIFQNGSYKAYPINSDYVIPPYSAFFVKSSGQTEIKITHNQLLSSFELIQPSSLSVLQRSEPETKDATSIVTVSKISQTHFAVNNQTLTLDNVPCQGYIEIFNITGNRVLKQTCQQGNLTISLSLKPGVYLIKLNTPIRQETKKFILL